MLTKPDSLPVGRFAPSPTGDLHFGSLLAAVASYCNVRTHNGLWRLRIDDIDPPRAVAGSADAIQRTLEQYGFTWDGPILWQRSRIERYRDALSTLIQQDRVFACSCSRRMLAAQNIYPGTCRHQRLTMKSPTVKDKAIRLQVEGSAQIQDIVFGPFLYDLSFDCGDTIIWRRDGLVSYALACAVDDGDQVTEVIRGADLLSSTAAQLAIMQYLKLPIPDYAHVPVALDKNLDKLSKHSRAPAINALDPVKTLISAWNFLGQQKFGAGSISEFWSKAIDTWDINRVPARGQQQL